MNSTEQREQARLAGSAVASPLLPDLLDPELEPAEQARLTNSPLVILPPRPSQPIVPAHAVATHRYAWQWLQQRRNWWVIVVFIWPLWWSLSTLWAEFVGTWQFTWPVLLSLLAFVLLVQLLLMEFGERIPHFGAAWVEVTPSGVRFRLFYGRKPFVLGRSFNLAGLIWPRRRTLRWAEVARAALYRVEYPPQANQSNQSWRTMYWLKLWTANLTGYTVLITVQQDEAEALMRQLAEGAGLRRWADLGNENNVVEASFGPLDSDTITIWQRDRKRISGSSNMGNTVAALWRNPAAVLSPPFRLTAKPIIAAVLFAALIVAALNYDVLLSYLLWSLPGAAQTDSTWLGSHHDAGNTASSAQTIIPPLHEVWHANLDRTSNPTHLSLSNGKLLALSGLYVRLYDANSGNLLTAFDLYDEIGSNTYNYAVQDGSISADGQSAYLYVSASQSGLCSPQSDCKLLAVNLADGSLIWQQRINSPFIYDVTRNQLIASVSTTISGAEQRYQVQSFDTSNGGVRWRAEVVQTAATQLALAGDNVYTVSDIGNSHNLYAFDASSGLQGWVQNTVVGNYGYILVADDSDVYVVGSQDVQSFTASGQNRWTQRIGSSVRYQAALLDGRVVTLNYDELLVADEFASTTLDSPSSPNRFHYQANNALAIADGLLYARSYNYGSLFGQERIIAYDLRNLRQVWRSPILGEGGGAILVGNGLLYTTLGNQLRAYAGAR